MSKFRIEIQVTVLAIIIGVIVVTMGYFSYVSLSKIVSYIQQGTHPNNKIFVIKEIDSDLNALENTVRLYALTNKYEGLEVFYSLEDNITQNLKELESLNGEDAYDIMLIDSISNMSLEKLNLWNEILNIHLSKKGIFPAFSKLYSNLEVKRPDSFSADTQNDVLAPNTSNNLNAAEDSVLTDHSVERMEIKKQIQKLEWEIYNNSKKKNVLESQLIEKNVIISQNFTQLISEAEIREENVLLKKTAEADRLAEESYKRLAIFTISTILLLFIALFVLFNYLKKARVAQLTLSNARKKAESLAIAKEQFAANVSHELRTPVNAIYGLTEQVLQKKLDSKTAEMVSIIFKSAGHLKNIVNETLDFSKIQSGNIILKLEHFYPAEIFEEVYSLVKFEAANKGIELRLKWEGKKPGILVGDPIRLKQILINLVGNALKFTEKGEVTIKVKGVKKVDEKTELEIQIIDTGIGIEKDQLSKVFDEYVQIEHQAGKKYSGTGLGLSIVKKLVVLQGGTIKLESIIGMGTKVTVNIPYSKGDPSKIEVIEDKTFEIPVPFKQLSVLIADDEEYNRFLLKNILLKWGVHFREANNGNEAINAVCNEHFDIVLMDINMPEMSGFEAAKAILKCDPGINIIAISAAAEKLDQQTCYIAGMKGFLFKPFSEKDLFEMINLLIQEKLTNSKPINNKQPFDISGLKRLAGNDEKFLAEMIQLFIKSMESGISGIENAIKSENLNEVFECAHKMAAPVKHIGAGNLYDSIKLLERISKQTVPITAISNVFQEIKNDIGELNSILIAYLNEIKS